MSPAKYVTWDRWDAEHRALREHEDGMRAALEERLSDRIGDVESRCTVLEAAKTRRVDRAWIIAMAFLTGLVLPLIVLAVTTLAHSGG